MHTLRSGGLRASPLDRYGVWSVILAVLLTFASFGGVVATMYQPHSQMRFEASAARSPQHEAVVFFTPRQPAQESRAAHPARPIRAPRARVTSTDTATRAGAAVPLATDVAKQATPANGVTEQKSSESLVPASPSTRLTRARHDEEPWYVAPRGRNPFKPAKPLTIAEQDSVLRRLGTDVPDLAFRRGQTVAERDARAKEAMLKMRLAGRVLLVPPDNSGGLITSSIPLSLFSAKPPSARRARSSSAEDDNRARLERLRQRADSLRRVRIDSVPHK